MKELVVNPNLVDEVLIEYECKPVDRFLLNEIQLYETMVPIHVLMSI